VKFALYSLSLIVTFAPLNFQPQSVAKAQMREQLHDSNGVQQRWRWSLNGAQQLCDVHLGRCSSSFYCLLALLGSVTCRLLH